VSEFPRVPFGHADLAENLRSLGLLRGDGVFVHCSLRSVGPVLAGPRTVIDALVEAVGPRGLVAMPAFSSDALMPPLPRGISETARIALEAQVPGFDPDRSSAIEMGAVAETFRRWPGVRRSRHPLCSISALGPEAEAVTARHSRDWPLGLDGPMGRLAERPEMKVLMIGVGWNRCSALHTAETMAVNRRLCVRHFKDLRQTPPRWVHARDVADDHENWFPEIGAAFEATGAVVSGRVGDAQARFFSMCDLLAFAAPWLSARNGAREREREARARETAALSGTGDSGR
jgi:aminoglycoside 3-N-acetyltransferase